MSTELALIVAVALLFGNAFFVGAEFALVSVRRSAVELRVAAGSAGANITLRALGNVSFLMAGAQLGVTLCSLGLGALGEPAIAHILEGPFHSLGMPDHLLHPAAFAVALSVMVYLHVVLGEVVPKNIALANPERSALLLIPMLVFVVKVLNPVVHLLNAFANLCLRVVGVKPQAEVTSEIAALVEESHRGGLLDEEKEQLLSGALQFASGTAAGALIPLTQVTVLKLPLTPADFEDAVATSGYSRFPVRNASKTDIIGYLHLKDTLEVDPGQRNQPIDRKLVRPLVSVYGDEPLSKVLKTMQHTGSHIAAVTNRRKKLLGIVTMEDVLEELIGESAATDLTL